MRAREQAVRVGLRRARPVRPPSLLCCTPGTQLLLAPQPAARRCNHRLHRQFCFFKEAPVKQKKFCVNHYKYVSYEFDKI